MEVTIHESFSEFTEAEWNALPRGDFVFADHRFLSALERGRCLGRRTGWFPRIYACRSAGVLVGALISFDKSNSYGEYIFDWAWANAAEQIGFDYYPKRVVAIPFTPATGPKILTADLRAREMMLERLLEDSSSGDSSLHFLFEPDPEASLLRERSLLMRHSYQYHWRNRGWKDFAEFLGALRSKRRSEIRRERSLVASSGVTIECLTGDALTAEHALAMTGFYRSTIFKMGGHAYLSAEFFNDVFARMKDSLLYVQASYDGVPVAGALNFYSGGTLFGRYWGCSSDEFKNLHFEVCYYQAIEWALARGFLLFEAGAQGEHKFNRGFTPSLCLSAHEIYEPRLRSAVSDFLEREKVSIDELFAEYRDHDPFQRSPLGQ